MLTAEEIRNQRLKLLVEQYGVSGLAKMIGRTYSQVSQWKNRTKRGDNARESNIDGASCRRIEEILGLPRGWMDNEALEPMAENILNWFNKASREQKALFFALSYACFERGEWPADTTFVPCPTTTPAPAPAHKSKKKPSPSRP